MDNTITIEEALELSDPVFIDVRSPREFGEGKIFGAVNIPLLDDKEREIIGCVYKEAGPLPAREEGLSLVSGKLPDLINQIKAFSRSGRDIIIYCWRGGMRSKSVTDLLKIVGLESKVKQLEGGYKSYRSHILAKLQNFELKPQIIVLCGSTGTGKTAILKLLAEKNLPVINLEELAGHRGSVFGQVGLGKQISAKNFDVAVLNLLEKFNDKPYIVAECESKRIGDVYLPEVLYQCMRKGKRILLSASIENRISRLMEEYLDIYQQNKSQIMAKVELLRRRLGNKKTNQIISLLAGNANGKNTAIEEAVKILLTDYYDPLYGYEKIIAPGDNAKNAKFEKYILADDLTQAAAEIIDYLKQIETSDKLGGIR